MPNNDQTTLDALACPRCGYALYASSGCESCGFCAHLRTEGALCLNCGELLSPDPEEEIELPEEEYGNPVGQS